MKQYTELKGQVPDALLFFRMGDFYELFGDDAVVAARVLEITLTSRDKGKENPLPMAGVPFHSAQGYLQRLLKAGYKVAIAEQMEDPTASRASGKTIVRRDIVRVFTPAVQFDGEGAEPQYLAIALPGSDFSSHPTWVLGCLDASTGEVLVSDPLPAAEVIAEVSRLPIRHWLKLAEAATLPDLGSPGAVLGETTLLEELPLNYLGQEQASELLKRHYRLSTLDTFFPEETAQRVVGILVHYVVRSQRQPECLAHLRFPQPLRRPQSMALGPRTPEHLDLLPLFTHLNRTRSALGSRQLRSWMWQPLREPAQILSRQSAVRELAERANESAKISGLLGQVYDLERICGRINSRLANPRDTLALGQSLAVVPEILNHLRTATSETLSDISTRLHEASRRLALVSERILRTQREDAPFHMRDAGIFRVGTTPELDHLISLTEEGSRWLVELETREREATGIPSLKVRYNRVFGYYIEVTSSHLKNVPAHYQRKQTTVGGERFFTEELKKFEDEIVTAESRKKALEQQLFEELLGALREQMPPLLEAARALAELDALRSFSTWADQPGWTFPIVDDTLELHIEAGRHPLVDHSTRGSFVPNDLDLGKARSLVITGPNMGGKSTVMRQTALIVLLGQCGSPVPARRARWGSVSSLYTRIGAHDAIARGQSTFMVEMSELAHLLHHADPRSLLILDEIGRGTSTYDGISVAWSTLEWICRQIGARTLFATHYHELTRLEGELPGLANAHMAAEATGGKLRFLYQLKSGPTNESFGVHVAQLAGIPAPVIERAWQVLERLEAQAGPAASLEAADRSQLSLFDLREAPAILPSPIWVGELRDTDLNSVTPLEALNILSRLQGEARQVAEKV